MNTELQAQQGKKKTTSVTLQLADYQFLKDEAGTLHISMSRFSRRLLEKAILQYKETKHSQEITNEQKPTH